MKRFGVFALFLIAVLVPLTLAQVSIANNTPVTINFAGYTGAGFQPTPTAGQLDSDTWAVTGWSDGDLAFGGTRTLISTDYTRGTSAANVGTSGFYAFTGSPGSVANPAFLLQPGSSDFAPGTLTLRIQNNGFAAITQLNLSYIIFNRNDQARSSSLNFSYSSDNITYMPVGALDFASPTTAGSPTWNATSRATSITGVSIASGAFFYIRWNTADAGGMGTRDELGLDDIVLAATFASPTAFVVNSNNDSNDAVLGNGICDAGGGVCTLRAAIQEANATAGSQTINFNGTLFATQQTIALTTGVEIEISSDLTINGPGANLLTINGGTGSNRIFFNNGGAAAIEGVTISGGDGIGTASNGAGGAIFSSGGTLVLDGVHLTGNTGNPGAGAYIFGGANHQIINSTISANTTAGTCGGFLIESSSLSITSSTISGNSATVGGGGFCNNSTTATLRNSTITGNVSGGAASGGGISQSFGTLNLGSTIVAGNTAGNNPDIHFPNGTIISAGFNLIGINTSVETAFPEGSPNTADSFVGTAADPVDPLLDVLGNNGGPTPTHALKISPVLSPALDRGEDFGTPLDQRGFMRTFDDPNIPNGQPSTIFLGLRGAVYDGTDIGAYERLSPTAASASISGRVMTADGRGIKGASITLSTANGPERNLRVITGTFGYYRLDDLRVGETYVLTVGAKRYAFANPSRVVSLDDEVSDADFTALR